MPRFLGVPRCVFCDILINTHEDIYCCGEWFCRWGCWQEHDRDTQGFHEDQLDRR